MPPRKLQIPWIEAYAAAVLPITEAPGQYVMWSAISVISAVLKQNVFIKWGTYTIFPNQYIVLVGPPGVGKGSAIHPAHAFIKDYKPELANYLTDRVTAPKIIERLAAGFSTLKMVGTNPIASTESSVVLMASELPSLLGGSDWMLTFLCDAWDRNEYEYQTKNQGSNFIKDMCVSLMGACVPDYIRKLNKDSTAAINGGFTARTIFVFANDKSQSVPWPIALNSSDTGKTKIANLREDLERVAALRGVFTFSPSGRHQWEYWYNTGTKPEDDDSDVVRHFKARQGTHVMKVSMCLSASRDDSMIIDDWCIKSAIMLTNAVKRTLDMTFRGVGESSLADATAKIQTYIEKKGMCTRQELIKSMHRHVTPEDLDRCLAVLKSIDFLEDYSANGRFYYRHKTGKIKGTP